MKSTNTNKTIESLNENQISLISQNSRNLDLNIYEGGTGFSVIFEIAELNYMVITLSYGHEFGDHDENFYRSHLRGYGEDRLGEITFGKRMNLVDWIKNKTNKESEEGIGDLSEDVLEQKEKEKVQKDIEGFSEEILKIFEEKRNISEKIQNFYNKLDSKIDNASNPISKLTYQLSKTISIGLLKNKNSEIFDNNQKQEEYEEEIKSFIVELLNKNNRPYSIEEFNITIPKDGFFGFGIKIKNNDTGKISDIKRTMILDNGNTVKKKISDFFEENEF